MATVGQANFAITPVVGFTLQFGFGPDAGYVATLRLFDSYGWEFTGLGFNDGGSWRWDLDGIKVRIVLSTRKTYDSGLPFAYVRKLGKTSWPFSPYVSALGPPKPWFSTEDFGTATISAVADNYYIGWWLGR